MLGQARFFGSATSPGVGAGESLKSVGAQVSDASGPGPESTSRRLGRNVNGYLGETIEVGSVLRECVFAAQSHGWSIEDIPVDSNLSLSTFARRAPLIRTESDQTPRFYISAGIHGDEPAGPLAVLQLLKENRWPVGFSYWICPCLNPNGFLHNRRENSDGVDLNRQYL